MKKVLFALAAGAMLFAGCTKGLEDRVSVLEQKVASLEEVVAALDREMDGISSLVSNLQDKVYVTGVTPNKDISGKVVGYTISFTEGEPITISNGETGPQGPKGDAGLTPTIDMFEGEWYWKYEGGDWILDSAGKKIPAARQLDFELGADGHLYVTVQGGTRIDLGDVTGEDGAPGTPGAPGAPGAHGDSWFDGVTVDETAGVVTISIKDSEHDIVFPLYQFALKVTVPENVTAFAGSTITLNYSVSEVAAATTVVRAYPSKGLEAVVDSKTNTIAVTLGMESGYVDVYAINNATGEIKAQSVEIAAGEKLQVNVTETELVLAPDGTGSVEIPVSTVVEYVVEVPAWASYEVAPAVKAVRDEVITVKPAAENTTANDYKGYVVLKEKETGAELCKVAIAQKNYLPSLITDAEGETIQWEETFDLYRYESDITTGEPKASFKNVFTVALSDDFSKGVYKISNMFKADVYYNQGQMMSGKGGEYYADIEGNVVTIKTKGSIMSYGFSKDFDLAYDAEAQTMTASAPIAAYAYGGVLANRDCFVVNYSVAVKQPEAPAGVDVTAFYGTYNEANPAPYAYSKETLVITESDNSSYDLKMQFFYTSGEYSSGYELAYGKVNADGTVIEVTFITSNILGPVTGTTAMSVNGNTISGTIQTQYMGVVEYSATKEASFDISSLYGTYNEANPAPYAYSKETLVITKSDNSSYDLKMQFFYTSGEYSSGYELAYGKVNAGGTAIEVTFTTSNILGPVSGTTVLSVKGNTISGTIQTQYMGVVEYSATK
jgi:hypothetical protein